MITFATYATTKRNEDFSRGTQITNLISTFCFLNEHILSVYDNCGKKLLRSEYVSE